MSADTSESSPARRYALLAIKLSISVVLMVVLFASIDVGSLWRTAKLASIPWLVIALVIFVVVKIFLRERPKAPTTKACPQCLEMVPLAATRCRACTQAI